MVHNQRYTKNEIDKIFELLKDGKDYEEIGKLVKRTPIAVKAFIKRKVGQGKKNSFTKEENKKIIALYNNGVLVKDIGKETNRTKKSIEFQLVKLRKEKLITSPYRNNLFSEDEDNLIIEMLHKDSETAEIANKLGRKFKNVSNKIYYLRKKLNIPYKRPTLNETHPELCEIWDYKLNTLSPENVTKGVPVKIWWICKKGHRSYRRAVNEQSLKKIDFSICPICSLSIKGKRQHSLMEHEWLNKLGIIDRNVPIYIKDRKFIVDGLNGNTVYEFYGDFWHGNPKLFKRTDYNSVVKKNFGELYDFTVTREYLIRKAGFNVITMWEYDFLREKRKK
jgi:transposase